jgi:hypothetical protein
MIFTGRLELHPKGYCTRSSWIVSVGRGVFVSGSACSPDTAVPQYLLLGSDESFVTMMLPGAEGLPSGFGSKLLTLPAPVVHAVDPGRSPQEVILLRLDKAISFAAA